MCESLGIGGVPQTPARASLNSDVQATPKPQSNQQKEVNSLKVRLEDKDQEIAALRKELGVLMREKKDLGVKCERLEKDASARSTVGQGGLDAKQVEELVKQFNDQEALLGEQESLYSTFRDEWLTVISSFSFSQEDISEKRRRV